MLCKKLSIVFGVCGLVAGSYALAQTGGGSAAKISAEMNMQNVMMDNQMIAMVGNSLIADDRLASMVGHEVMVQKMLKNEAFMKKVRDGLKVDNNPEKRKQEMDRFSTVLRKMMGDQATVKRVMKDVMIRQIAKVQMKMAEGNEAKENETKE